MIRIPFDVPDLAVTQRYPDAAAARTHVAGGVLDFFPAWLGFHVHNGIQHGQILVMNPKGSLMKNS
jgi:hypothetical protein